ncbi:hypothetical protein [Calidifontibacillus erzurumensis]|nr:hypothetical protein [Calidifontibacillus erzurumensis]
MIGLLLYLNGFLTEPIIAIGSTITTIGIILFCVNVYKNVSAADRKV